MSHLLSSKAAFGLRKRGKTHVLNRNQRLCHYYVQFAIVSFLYARRVLEEMKS